MELIKVNQVKCIKCGICTKVCPPKVLGMGENKRILKKATEVVIEWMEAQIENPLLTWNCLLLLSG